MINRIPYRCIFGSFLLICVAVFSARAEELVGSPLTVHTFGTLCLSTSNSETLGFIRDYQQSSSLEDGTFNYLADSNLGVQLSRQYGKATGTLQLLARGRINNDLQHLINYAFVDFHITNNATLRLGKNPLELYLSSDNRGVGYSQMQVRPIPEFYTLLFAESYPGVDFRYKHQLEGGILTLGGFLGTLDITFLPDHETPKDYSYDPMVGCSVRYTTFESTFLVSYLVARISDVSSNIDNLRKGMFSLRGYQIPEASRLEEAMDIENAFAHYFIAGVSTQCGNWALQSEVNYFLLNQVGHMRLLSGYVSAGYHWHSWTPYAVVAGIHTWKDNVEIDYSELSTLPVEAASMLYFTETFYNAVSANQFSTSLGLRWDFHPGVALKFQWGHYWVEQEAILLWEAFSDDAYDGGQVDVFSVSLDYAF